MMQRSSIDSDNSDLEVKKDDSDKQGILYGDYF